MSGPFKLTGTRMERCPVRSMTVARQPLPKLAAELAGAGCLNPAERAEELDHTGRCRFYRPDDGTVVHVTMEAA